MARFNNKLFKVFCCSILRILKKSASSFSINGTNFLINSLKVVYNPNGRKKYNNIRCSGYFIGIIFKKSVDLIENVGHDKKTTSAFDT